MKENWACSESCTSDHCRSIIDEVAASGACLQPKPTASASSPEFAVQRCVGCGMVRLLRLHRLLASRVTDDGTAGEDPIRRCDFFEVKSHKLSTI